MLPNHPPHYLRTLIECNQRIPAAHSVMITKSFEQRGTHKNFRSLLSGFWNTSSGLSASPRNKSKNPNTESIMFGSIGLVRDRRDLQRERHNACKQPTSPHPTTTTTTDAPLSPIQEQTTTMSKAWVMLATSSSILMPSFSTSSPGACHQDDSQTHHP